MSDTYEKMSMFEQLKSGLKDSIAFSRGEVTLVATELEVVERIFECPQSCHEGLADSRGPVPR